MSSAARVVLVVLAVSLAAVPGVAQQRDTIQILLARARHLADSLRARDQDQQRLTYESALKVEAGPVRVILPPGDDLGRAQFVAAEILRQVREFGAVPDDVIMRYALVPDPLGLPTGGRLDGRTVVLFSLPGSTGELRGQYEADNAAYNLVAAAIEPSWRAWLGGGIEFHWPVRVWNNVVVNEMALSHWSSARGCMTGDGRDCARYLGIAGRSSRAWYSAADIRSEVVRQRGEPTAASACPSGGENACWNQMDPPLLDPPSPPIARRSVVHFVRATMGPAALQAMLRDSTGTIGERLRRHTRQAPLELMAAWRLWVLDTAEREPVHAGGKELISTILAAGLLLTLAARSGRWHA